MSRKALLIIDVQAGLCVGQYKAFDVDGLIERINSVSQRARAAGLPVVVIQHEEDEGFVYGSDAWQLGEGLLTADSDLRIRKSVGNAFQDTALHELLQELGVSDLIACGMQSDFCVDATVHGAVALGYPVTLISDGHSTLDSEGLTAAQIIAQRNDTLSRLTGRVSLRFADEVLRDRG